MTREEALRELMDIRDEATAYPDAVCYVTSEDEDALNVAIEALQAEAVQVVRCKDCKEFRPNAEQDFERCRYHWIYVEEHDWCSYGERREE